jgi:hypothetical protein
MGAFNLTVIGFKKGDTIVKVLFEFIIYLCFIRMLFTVDNPWPAVSIIIKWKVLRHHLKYDVTLQNPLHPTG